MIDKNTLQGDLKLYSVKEIAEICGVSSRTVWNYIKAGKLEAFKVGRQWRVSEAQLKAFVTGA